MRVLPERSSICLWCGEILFSEVLPDADLSWACTDAGAAKQHAKSASRQIRERIDTFIMINYSVLNKIIQAPLKRKPICNRTIDGRGNGKTYPAQNGQTHTMYLRRQRAGRTFMKLAMLQAMWFCIETEQPC